MRRRDIVGLSLLLPGVLPVSAALLALGVVGIALIAVGYRLITTEVADAPPPRPVDAPGVWHWLDV